MNAQKTTLIFFLLAFLVPASAAPAKDIILPDEIILTESQILTAPAPKDPNERAERINAKFDELHGNLDKFLDTAIASDQIFEPNEIEFLKKEKVRSQRAKDRINDQDGFKGVGQKNKFNKKDPNTVDEYNDEAFEDFEGSLDDLNNMLIEADTELNNANAAKAMYVLAVAAAGTNKCQELVDASINLGVASSVIRGLAIVADTVYNSTAAAGNQTAFGFNCSSIAIVFAVAAGALDMTATGLEIADEWMAEDLKAECLNQINTVSQGTADAVDELNQKVTELQQQLEALKVLMNQRLDKIESLLNTPQGRRPAFPVKTQSSTNQSVK